MRRIPARIWIWLTGWLPLSRRTNQLRTVIADLDQRVARIVADGERRDTSLRMESAALDRQYDVVKKELTEARQLIERGEDALNAIREELRVSNEVTIPALVAAHALILERWDHETAILARHRTAVEPREE